MPSKYPTNWATSPVPIPSMQWTHHPTAASTEAFQVLFCVSDSQEGAYWRPLIQLCHPVFPGGWRLHHSVSPCIPQDNFELHTVGQVSSPLHGAPCMQIRQIIGHQGKALSSAFDALLASETAQPAGCLPPGQTSGTHCKATSVDQFFNPRLYVVQLKKSPSTNLWWPSSLSDGECYT